MYEALLVPKLLDTVKTIHRRCLTRNTSGQYHSEGGLNHLEGGLYSSEGDLHHSEDGLQWRIRRGQKCVVTPIFGHVNAVIVVVVVS